MTAPSRGFTGTNWTVNVASRAIEAGLTKGNENFVGTRAATREACLYAVNALKATLVEYESKGHRRHRQRRHCCYRRFQAHLRDQQHPRRCHFYQRRHRQREERLDG